MCFVDGGLLMQFIQLERKRKRKIWLSSIVWEVHGLQTVIHVYFFCIFLNHNFYRFVTKSCCYVWTVS